MQDFEQARWNMVENQLRPSNIDDRLVLDSMGSVPREAFLPAQLRGIAYGDDDINLGNDQFLIEPLALSKLVQAASVQATDVALIIGCTTGYAAAVVGKLCATTFLLVGDQAAADNVDSVLSTIGCDNVISEVGKTSEGLPSQAPFDVIILASGVRAISETWTSQLSEGGRLTSVVNERGFGKVTCIKRRGDQFDRFEIADASIPTMRDELSVQPFEF